MLTYNLSCLYAYSLSIKEGEDDDDEGGVAPIITEIVLHRVVAVLAGVIWGMIITRVIWPISARKKFKDGLSLMWLRMALIWKRDPLSVMLEGESATKYMNLSEEFALQAYGTSLPSYAPFDIHLLILSCPFAISTHSSSLRVRPPRPFPILYLWSHNGLNNQSPRCIPRHELSDPERSERHSWRSRVIEIHFRRTSSIMCSNQPFISSSCLESEIGVSAQ